MLREFFDNILFKLGYIPERELILRSLPKEKQRRARQIVRQLNELKSVSNVGECFRLSTELSGIFRESADKVKSTNPVIKDAVRLIGGDIYGYRPAAAKLYGLFQSNPFGVYAFVARHHWAVRTALSVIRNEIINDGFQLRSEKGVTKKRIKDVYRQLKQMGVFDLRIGIATHLKLYGNAWVLPHRNLLGGPQAFELLAPPKLLPIIDPQTEQIVGWEYSVGKGTVKYPLKRVLHLYQLSVDNYRALGDPPLAPAILGIEADLAADSFNNQMFQKGGMMGIILNIKTPEGDPITRDEDDVVDELQDRIDAQFSGSKAAHSVLVTNNLENVFHISEFGKLDSSFQTLHMETAKTVANCLDVPPEKIAVSRSDTLQYIPSLVEDSVNAQFDKSLNSLMSLVDEFINERILRDILGITDVRIVASGRYGALTKNAADTIKTLADAGPIVTVNEALERILGWDILPPDNPRGNYVLDNTVNRELETKPQISDPPKDDFNLDKSLSSDAFIYMLDGMKQGRFERKDITYSSDEESCDVAIIKKGVIRFYVENWKKNKKAKNDGQDRRRDDDSDEGLAGAKVRR